MSISIDDAGILEMETHAVFTFKYGYLEMKTLQQGYEQAIEFRIGLPPIRCEVAIMMYLVSLWTCLARARVVMIHVASMKMSQSQ
jgi:hypothetical protein